MYVAGLGAVGRFKGRMWVRAMRGSCMLRVMVCGPCWGLEYCGIAEDAPHAQMLLSLGLDLAPNCSSRLQEARSLLGKWEGGLVGDR